MANPGATNSIPIEGVVDPAFKRVKEAFIANFEEAVAGSHEVGAAVAITLDNRPVVDLWGGFADRARTRPWSRDTLVNVWSTTKGLTAICVHRLVEQGRLDLEAPVARYWPEFAAAGKEQLPVAWLLDHKAGLPAVRQQLVLEDIYNWERITGILAAHQPWWEPGTRHGYHALTFGWLNGELVRRITGKSVGAYFRDELARPLGLDTHIGLAASEDHRVAEMMAADPPPAGEHNQMMDLFADRESISFKALGNPPFRQGSTVNSRAWRGAEIPAANGHTTARGLARLYGGLACEGAIEGLQVLREESIEHARQERSNGPDAVLLMNTRFGLGFMLPQPETPWSPNVRSFGHPGAGGSLAFADRDARVGFAYVMNKMGQRLIFDPRVKRLTEALYSSL